MRARTALTTAALAALLLTTGLAAPAAADAAASLPICDDWTKLQFSGAQTEVATVPTAGHSTGNTQCKLERGNVYNGVWVLQEAMNRCHNAGLAQDGIYGQHTYHAIVWAQASFNRIVGFEALTVDGVYGPRTGTFALRWPFYRFDEGSRRYVFTRCTAVGLIS